MTASAAGIIAIGRNSASLPRRRARAFPKSRHCCKRLTRAPSRGQTKAERLASEVQQALRALGYYEGPLTGTVGPQTKKSIAEFEKAFALPVTGRISPDLLRRLGIAWP